jgi:hypothetical protein
MAVGFLFPPSARSKKPKRPMSTTLIENKAPRLEPPPVEDMIPDLAFLLGLVYLDAGLPPEAALRSALADYECSFSGPQMEAL